MAEVSEYWSILDKFFFTCAVAGGSLVVLRVIFMFLGGDGLGEGGEHGGLSIEDGGDIEAHHADSDIGFKALSLQGVSSFFLMFGLVGLTMSRQSGLNPLFSITGGTLAGAASVWIIGKIFQFAVRLQSSGTADLSKTVGNNGTVYLKIPSGGTGRVTVNFLNRQMELDAVSKDGSEIPSGGRVRVVSIQGNVVTVEKIA